MSATTTRGRWAAGAIDVRDPSADRRLVEFCLTVPADQYLANGVPRALARRAFGDRLPPAVTNERRKGWQGADWHEGLTVARARLADEFAHIERNPAAAAIIDTPRLRAMISDWPTGSWTQAAVVERYRLALLRGVSMGNFMRSVAGTN